MIGITGIRGAGKTREAVAELYEYFLLNDDCIFLTNTPLYFPPHPTSGKSAIVYRWRKIEELMAFCYFAMEWGDEVLNRKWFIFMDEASVQINARDWKNIDPALSAFMFQSRHVGVEIIFTTQNPAMVDSNFRRLVEVWKCVKKVKIGPFDTPFSVIIEKELDPSSGADREILSKRYRFFVRKYWKMYKTDGKDSVIGLEGRTEYEQYFSVYPAFLAFLNSVVPASVRNLPVELPSAPPEEREAGEGLKRFLKS
jgi:hypothetical protein